MCISWVRGTLNEEEINEIEEETDQSDLATTYNCKKSSVKNMVRELENYQRMTHNSKDVLLKY